MKDVQTFTRPADPMADWVLWVSDGSNLNTGPNFLSPGAIVTQVAIDGTP